MSRLTLYEDLLATCKSAFSQGHYETAYHILCAATHYAKDVGCIDYLNELLKMAHEQSDWINAHATENVLSGAHVKARNGVDMFKSLFRHIEGDILIVKTKQRKHPNEQP